jgi:hypothetical protein
MKLFKIVMIKEVEEKPEYTKVYAISDNALRVDSIIPGCFGRIHEKAILGDVDVIMNANNSKFYCILYKATNKYGKPIYVVQDQPGIESAERAVIKRLHSIAAGISEERVNVEEASNLGYYVSIEELGKVFICG